MNERTLRSKMATAASGMRSTPAGVGAGAGAIPAHCRAAGSAVLEEDAVAVPGQRRVLDAERLSREARVNACVLRIERHLPGGLQVVDALVEHQQDPVAGRGRESPAR